MRGHFCRRPLESMRRTLLAVLLLVASASASIFSGFNIGREFSYIGKFCFGFDEDFTKTVGVIQGRIRTPDDGVQLAIYDDEAMFWQYVMGHDDATCDCECKLSAAHTKYVFNVSRATDNLHAFQFNFSLEEHLRPRFWYVALAKCVPGGAAYTPSFLKMSPSDFLKYYFTAWYYLHFTQGDGSEVPVYQEDLDMVYMAFAVLSGIALALQMTAARQLHRSEAFHPIIQLVTTIATVFFSANAMLALHFAAFKWNGFGIPLLLGLGRVCQALLHVLTLLLAMLIAKGWTINSITLEGRSKLTTVMVLLLVLYVSLAMWYLIGLDPASTLYLYDSWPGLGICALHCFVLVWFLSTLSQTRQKEDVLEKRAFFTQMGVLFAIYVLSVPFMVALASLLSPWVREKIVDSVTVGIEFVTYSILIFLLWPSRAPKYFERLYSLCGTSAEKTNLRDASLPTDVL
ncbi:hypothetical protein SDRG_15846 [Saprolegnia diclina VS20]|uniref:GPR180/TMEM145 transmembrane domain-containing protein n=1 Tax=Saprolegnia diclina (strain VS20) TaxID=1156394 RepID=T0PVR5_SAPDV|nr:hypothetical protein SDRG_15846 [Saprolegnia diclina VS20]EQC26361.1 hypothetical protein SDRG_15846 [Saprolegnia diclina VS20]|eukprot:XP_008620254.1 hypothetical protein SDRG_15846 [Saprolegnia diclina VS20]